MVQVITATKYKLALRKREVEFLRDLTQNALSPESPQQATVRCSLFKAFRKCINEE